jgi:hypothetical protein
MRGGKHFLGNKRATDGTESRRTLTSSSPGIEPNSEARRTPLKFALSSRYRQDLKGEPMAVRQGCQSDIAYAVSRDGVSLSMQSAASRPKRRFLN